MGLRTWEEIDSGKRDQHGPRVTGPKEHGVCSELWAWGRESGVVGVGQPGWSRKERWEQVMGTLYVC